jgi:hypothetical protein
MLVPHFIAHHYSELERWIRPTMDGAGRRWNWARISCRPPSLQCSGRRLLQCVHPREAARVGSLLKGGNQ